MSYLENFYVCVWSCNSVSRYFEDETGVPQGSILRPLLFGLYVNDLPNIHPPGVVYQMHANDTDIYSICIQMRSSQKLSDAMSHTFQTE